MLHWNFPHITLFYLPQPEKCTHRAAPEGAESHREKCLSYPAVAFSFTVKNLLCPNLATAVLRGGDVFPQVQYTGTGTVLASACFSSTAISIPTNSGTRSDSVMALNMTKIICTIYPVFIYTKVILLTCYCCNFKDRQPRDSYFCKSKSYFLWQDALLHTNWNKARTDGAVPN